MDKKDLKELSELVEFLKSNEIAEFELDKGEQRVKIKFAGAVAPQFVQAAPVSIAAPLPAVTASAAAPAAAEEKLHEVKSPIVGTFYESPAPGASAFVKVGDQVEVGQVLCIVEAMKLMNEIESDVAGEVVRIIASNGQPVEFGQPLFAVRPR